MSQKALTLSIVIPVYNEESYIKSCLQAIAEQTVAPDEVIVIDNNSTDKTVQIAKLFPFVKVVKEKTPGVLAARNKGFNAAKSDIIGRIDGDTLLPPDWTEKVKETFISDENLAAISGPVSYYDMPLEPLNLRGDIVIRSLISKLHETQFLFGTNMAIRRSSWHLVKNKTCNDKTIHEDLDLAIHLSWLQEKIIYQPTIHARMSARRFDDSLPQFYRYMKMHPKTFEKHGIVTSLPHVAVLTYLFLYLVFKPFRMGYDQEAGKFRLRHLLFGRNVPRRNPMG